MSIDASVKLVFIGIGYRLTLLLFGVLGWTGFDVWHAGAAAWGQGDGGDDFGGRGRCVPDGWRSGVATGRDHRVSIIGRCGR